MKKSQQKFPMAGANEKTPSKAMYFSWINHAWEGANEPCTVASLNFFQWLHDEYGMKLDIYLLDAGTIDGLQVYGTTDSAGYHERFPRGLKPMVPQAAGFGSRLGMWMGPDGFGTTAKEEKARRDMIVAVARDHDMALFKFDGCCGNLRDDRSDSFARMMTEVRQHCPDLIALNHRINLDANALKQMTTWLWQGVETYIDVHIGNSVTAPHNRAAAMSRGLPPELSRLTEDHGVCLSSCLDYWEDDLVLQAFNRCLILAPEIYGNPWLLRDDEMPRLARLFNLHRRYRDILVNGMELPATYGPNAVSRGDAGTRMVTLTNLSWKAKTYTIELGGEIGLTDRRPVTVRQFHPGEKALGTFAYGSHVKVVVPAFRSCLVLATVKCIEEPGVVGGTFEVVRDVPGRPVELKLLGLPGTKAKIRLPKDGPQFAKAVLDGKNAAKILAGGSIDVTFPGRALKKPWRR
ncbi:MAG: hypothetical protein NT031_01055 [Planctomycetota bacterium]|nr:hypothetical protein [Planctomycetota bacterium]